MRNGNGGRGAERDEMARFPSLDAATADRLLDGEPAYRGELEPLELLLSAARAPGWPSEFAHEEAAIAAFHAARFAPVPVSERSRAVISWRRFLTVKAATLGLVGVLGGVAVAAGVTVVVVDTNDTTPTASAPGHGPGHPSSGSSGPSSDSPTLSATPSLTPSDSTSPGPSQSPTPGTSESTAPIPPNVIGLCQQWRKRYKTNPDETAADPHFAGLIAAAGGVDKVADFCTAQEALAQASSSPPTSPMPDSAATDPTQSART